MASNLRVDSIVPATGTNVAIGTAGGGVNIPGVLTYEDVTNVDSVGVITARGGIRIGATGANTLISGTATGIGIGEDSPDSLLHIGKGTNADDGAVALTIGGSSVNTRQSTITKNNVGSNDRALEIRAATGGSDETIKFFSDATTERLRIGSSGQIGIAGANYGTSGQVLKSQGASSAVQWASPSLAMADQWRVSTSQTTSSDTIADITGWSRNNNNFAGVGGALTNSGANFTFPSTGIYYVSYNIATYITSGSSRYISARLYFAGQDICHSWASSYHASGNQTTQSTGSQAIIDVTNTATQTFKIRIQSQNPVVVVGLNEAGYNSSVNMSEVVVMRIGDT